MRTQLVSLLPLFCVSLCVAAGCSDGDDFTVQPKSDAGVAVDGPDGGGQSDGFTPEDGSVGEDALSDGGVGEDALSDAGEEAVGDGGGGEDVLGDAGGEDGNTADGGADAAVSCDPGTADCDDDPANGCEVSTTANLDHCGSCGNVCEAGANATASCNAGVCGRTCEDGFEDCDDVALNGCEADLRSTSTCGSCGQICGNQHAAAACNAGSCELTCDAGFADCNGDPSDGCEAELAVAAANCGWCGHSCGGASCDQGVCEPTALATGQDGAFGLAVDNTTVYFGAFNAQVVGRVPKAGGTVETLLTGALAGFFAVDDTDVYFAQAVEVSPSLSRFSKTGPFVATEVVSGIKGNGFAVDSTSAYWSDATHQQIWRVAKAGGAPTSLATGQVKCNALAVSPTTVFWGLLDAEEIRAVPKAGGTPFVVVSGAGKPTRMVVDDTYLFWIASDGVHRATLAGSNHEIVVAQSGVTNLMTDDENVYFSSMSNGYVKAVSKSGGEVRTYATGLSQTVGLAVDDDAVYFTEGSGSQGGGVSRVHK